MSQQIIIGNCQGSPSNSAVNYVNFSSTRSTGGNWQAEASKESMRDICAVPGVISNWIVRADFPPTTGSWKFELFKNDVATGLELNITVGQKWDQDNVHSVSVAVNDTLIVKCTPTGTPTPAVRPAFSCVFTPTIANQLWLAGGPIVDANLTGTRQYQPVLGGTTWRTSTSTSDAMNLIPIACTLKDFYVTLNAAPGVGNTREFSIYLNGVQIAASVISITGASTSGSVTGMSQALAAGDLISYSHLKTAGTPTTGLPRFSCRVDATTDGEAFIAGTNSSAMSIAGDLSIIPFGSSTITATNKTFGPTAGFSVIPVYVSCSNFYVTTPFAGPGVGVYDYFSISKADNSYPGSSTSKRNMQFGYVPVTMTNPATSASNTTDIARFLPSELIMFSWEASASRSTTNAAWACRTKFNDTPPSYLIV